MAVIGIIDIALRAQTGPFVANIAKARTSIADFAKAAGRSSIAQIGAAASAIGPHLKSMAGDLAGIAGQLAKVGALAGGVAIASLAGLAAESLKNVDRQGDLAEKLEVSGGALAAFEHAVKLTGGPVEQLPEILGRLRGQLGLAARDAGPAAEGIKRLGLDAKGLAAAGPIEATKRIADALSRVPSSADRAAIAVSIFGEQGAKLAGTFRAGGAGIAALEQDARQLGLALADADYAKVAAANDQLDRAAAAIQGAGNALAVQLAPYIEAAAKKFVELATSGEGLGAKIRTGIGFAKTSIGALADGLHYARIGFLTLQVAATKAAATAVMALDLMGGSAYALVPGLKTLKDVFLGTEKGAGIALEKLSRDQAAALDQVAKGPPPSAGIEGFFRGIEHAADASAAGIDGVGKALDKTGAAMTDAAFKVAKLEDSLKDQIATFGKSASEIEIYKLRQAGASDADLGRVKALSRQLKALDDTKKAQDAFQADAKSILADTQTAPEKFRLALAKLSDLSARGLIDDETLSRAVDKAKRENGLDDTGYRKAGALELGSKEARSAILEFRGRQTETGDSDANIRKTAAATEQVANATGQLLVLARQRAANPAAIEEI